jgi:hypothetical protein
VTHGLDDGPYVNGCIPNARVETSTIPLHILTGQFRGPGYNSQCFLADVLDKARSLWPDQLRTLPMAAAHKEMLIAHWSLLPPAFRIGIGRG